MIAYHYPPYRGGSGVHRTLKFSRYLPEHGWLPVVLSAHPRAFASVGDDQLNEIPPEVIVERAFALDSSRHLAIAGRYSRMTALPDQWVSWWFGAVAAGLRLIREHRPAAIWSTYPIATAHWIGHTLHRLTGLPWVADFRDSMTEDDYPRDPWSRRAYIWIERKAVRRAARLIFTAASARRMYLARYPSLSLEAAVLLPNGYDEADFQHIDWPRPGLNGSGEKPIRLLHAGLLYTEERDPTVFFQTLAALKQQQRISAAGLRIDLRASGSEAHYQQVLQQFDIADMVRLLPPLPYHEALQDCATADGLLLFQAASCNHQIPAKAYEYLRLKKPIFALTPAAGDTGELLAGTDGATIVDLTDGVAIAAALPEFIQRVRAGVHPLPSSATVDSYRRSEQARQLANLLSQVAAPQTAGAIS